MAGLCTDRKWQNRCFPGSFDCEDPRESHSANGADDVVAKAETLVAGQNKLEEGAIRPSAPGTKSLHPSGF